MSRVSRRMSLPQWQMPERAIACWGRRCLRAITVAVRIALSLLRVPPRRAKRPKLRVLSQRAEGQSRPWADRPSGRQSRTQPGRRAPAGMNQNWFETCVTGLLLRAVGRLSHRRATQRTAGLIMQPAKRSGSKRPPRTRPKRAGLRRGWSASRRLSVAESSLPCPLYSWRSYWLRCGLWLIWMGPL